MPTDIHPYLSEAHTPESRAEFGVDAPGAPILPGAWLGMLGGGQLGQREARHGIGAGQQFLLGLGVGGHGSLLQRGIILATLILAEDRCFYNRSWQGYAQGGLFCE